VKEKIAQFTVQFFFLLCPVFFILPLIFISFIVSSYCLSYVLCSCSFNGEEVEEVDEQYNNDNGIQEFDNLVEE